MVSIKDEEIAVLEDERTNRAWKQLVSQVEDGFDILALILTDGPKSMATECPDALAAVANTMRPLEDAIRELKCIVWTAAPKVPSA